MIIAWYPDPFHYSLLEKTLITSGVICFMILAIWLFHNDTFRLICFRVLYKLQILRFFNSFYFHYEVKKYVKKGDVVIDIGANMGIYTKIFSDLGAEVYAVEPIPKFYKYFHKVKLYAYALGSEDKFVTMTQWRPTSGAYKINKDGYYWVHQVKGSELFQHLDKINFIKIDVEGSELPIIKDMAKLILKHKPMILIESGNIRKVLEYLKGYKIKDNVGCDYLLVH